VVVGKRLRSRRHLVCLEIKSGQRRPVPRVRYLQPPPKPGAGGVRQPRRAFNLRQRQIGEAREDLLLLPLQGPATGQFEERVTAARLKPDELAQHDTGGGGGQATKLLKLGPALVAGQVADDRPKVLEVE
jgi:hypothetical protein